MKRLYRSVAALLGIMLLTVSAGGETAHAANRADAQTIRTNAEIFVSQINDERVREGLDEIYLLPQLCDFSQVRAEEISVLFQHDRPDGSSCFTVMKNAGFFYNVAAENIAAGNETPVGTFEQLMNSSGHRKNMMNPSMTHIGIGYCYDPDVISQPDGYAYRHYWSMFLVGVYDSASAPATLAGQYIPEREPGDTDGSKIVDASDAANILVYSATQSTGTDMPVTSQFRKAANVNGDRWINAVDAQIVLAYASAKGTDPGAQLSDFIWSE